MNWNELEINEIYKKLSSNSKGLTTTQSEKRLKENGLNELPKKKNDSFLKIMLRQILDPILLVLLITVVFSIIIKEYIDAYAIGLIMIVDLIMGTIEEYKANKSALELSKLIKVKVRVIRNDNEIMIDSSELVVGDIVLLESGNKVSADIRIIECHNLSVNESILTGESISVVKSSDILIEPSSFHNNMVYGGTSILTGRATGIVTATGINTEVGKIAKKVTETDDTKSPLTIRMEKFSKQITIFVLIIALMITIVLFAKDFPMEEIFLSVVALSVSAMPEGLPLALTMALTIASTRMAKKNVIVKRLNAVESLGSCTVIASDKTGTLTINEQTAKKIILPDGTISEITGIGYNNKGKLSVINNNILKLITLGAINNEASLEYRDSKWISIGDSIDIAFKALALKAKVDYSTIKVIGSIPYESSNGFSAVFYEEKGDILCTVKGSIEKILEFTGPNEKIIQSNESFAKEGYRVIGIASGKVKKFEYKESYDADDIGKLIFDGMIGFIDPIREEVKGAIEECSKAGIKVVMITGDHPLTAYAIGKELSLVNNYNEVAYGDEIEKAFNNGPSEFDHFVQDKRVFARVTPLLKLEIVESYKRMGEFVAVTGDGVNDAPALKSANIGIAMGSGTDVAIETSSMIVIDDNFNSIVTGVKEGRNAYNNVRKVSYLLLSCGVAEVLFFLLSIIFDLPMPLLAIQLLWLNIVTDGLQDFALSFEKPEKGIMNRKPRKTNESIFNRELLSEVSVAGFTMGMIVFIVWYYLIKALNINEFEARGYIMVLMVFMQNMHVLNCRSERESFFSTNIKPNYMVLLSILCAIILQIIVMESIGLSSLLQVTTIPLIDMTILFLLSTLILIVMEAYKHAQYGRFDKR